MTITPFNRCVECSHIITNPLCPSCLAKNMKMIIGNTYPGLTTEIISANIEGNIRCTSCNQRTDLCTNCFSKDIYKYLIERNPAAAKEFRNRFEFECIKVRKRQK